MKKKEILVFAELQQNALAPVYEELLSKAAEIAKDNDWEVASLVIGNELCHAVHEISTHCQKVYAIEHDKLAKYTLSAYASAFVHAVKEINPEMILVGATGIGSELAPTVAARLKTGLAAHCVDIQTNKEQGRINCMVPAFGGKVVSEIYIPECRPMMASIRPGILEKVEQTVSDSETVIIDAAFLDDFSSGETFLEFVENQQSGRKIEESDVVIAVGRGAAKDSTWALANDLAEKLDGAVGWSRSFMDMGIVDNETNMIGTSGKSVKPSVFIGAGISGAAHFICGIGKSKLIINVNKDENAPIFKHSDYGVVGDAEKFLTALNQKLDN